MKLNIHSSGPEEKNSRPSQQGTLITDRICLKIAEAAQVMGVNPATIRRMIKRNLIRPYLGLRTPLIPVAQLRRLVEEQIEPEPHPSTSAPETEPRENTGSQSEKPVKQVDRRQRKGGRS